MTHMWGSPAFRPLPVRLAQDGALLEDANMRHPDTISETPAPKVAEPTATSRRALLRGLGMASVGAAALAAG